MQYKMQVDMDKETETGKVKKTHSD